MSRLKNLLTAGLVAAAVLVGAPAEATAKATFSLPSPTGHHQVGTKVVHLVDHARQDPWKPDRKRELMITVWYPARDASRYPRAHWISDGLLAATEDLTSVLGVPRGSVDWTGARSAGRVGAPVDRRFGGRPVVLYSPGLQGPRTAGTTQVQDLASHGYIVVAIDHTFETTVEFPGGRVEPSVITELDITTKKTAIDARVADARFVLDKLPELNRELGEAMNLSKIGMFGHSYGGYTAGETMYHDRRIDAGINLDGAMAYSAGQQGAPYLPGEVAKHGLDRPFKLMGSQILQPDGTLIDHSHLNDFDRSWGDFWANQHAWKRDVLLRGAAHISYTDLQAILPQLSGPLNIPLSEWTAVIGTINPAHSIKAQTTNIRTFFDRFL